MQLILSAFLLNPFMKAYFKAGKIILNMHTTEKK